MLKCTFCRKIFSNPGGLGSHQPYCKDNPKKITRVNSPNAHRKKGTPPWNKGLVGVQVPWNKGLVGDPRCSKESQPESIKKSRAEKCRVAIQKRYDSGWMPPKAGRCKKIAYVSDIAGTVMLDGTWELKVAKYFDRIGIRWKRNTDRFSYFDEQANKKRYYTPDFFVEDWNVYIEVKGYETELDRCKWRDFPHKLIVWKKNDLNNLENSPPHINAPVT